ncbi:MAG TPA: ATP-binding protein [Candidatus Entotheonella sp.]
MRSMLFRPSLRQLLSVLFFLFAALSAAAIGILWTQSAWDREVQTVQDQHLQLSKHLAKALTRYAKDVEAVFYLVALNLANQQPILHLDALLRRLHFKHICIVNRLGRVEQLLSPMPGLQIEHIPEQLLRNLLTAGGGDEYQLTFSNVLPDQNGEPTLYLWYPISPDRYALGALKSTYFVQLQQAIAFGENGHAVIVDRSGHVIAHPHPQWQASMKDISGLPPIRRMLAGETGVSWFYSPAVKADMVAGFTTSPETGWGIMVPQPVSELMANVAQVQWVIWSVVGLIVLGSALLGSLVAHWLASHLRRIGATAERFAMGFYEARVGMLDRFYPREAASLAAQFNTMADEVTMSWQARRESEERFRDFAQIAADWFWETDLNQVFTYMSPMSQMGRFWNAEAYLGRHRRDFIYDDTEGHVTDLIQHYMDREAPFDQVPCSILKRDGNLLHLLLSGRPRRNSEGVVVGYRGVARDITEHVRADEQLRQAQREEEMRQAQKMEAIGILAGGIAHDFNNTLGIILGYTGLTLQMTDDSQIQHNLQHVFNAGERAKDMVQQILAFSRKSDPERKAIYLHEAVVETLKLLRASLPTTIDIRQAIPAGIQDVVLADTTQMHQVIMNLCMNAAYAMRETGGILDVRISIRHINHVFTLQHPELRSGPHVCLIIRDTGCGMQADVVERIFEPYFTTKGVGEGTGMGLAVVHGIIASHSGAITVHSTPGMGTTFAIYLPQIDAVVDRETPGATPLLHGQGSILFVDDEAVLTFLAQEMLKQLGYEVEVHMNSLEALASFQNTPDRFDLVITDQTMPMMTGEVLAQELRKIRPDIPIILCTGYSHRIDADKAAAQGIDAFCMKPLVMHDLGVVIRRILAQRAAAETPRLKTSTSKPYRANEIAV